MKQHLNNHVICIYIILLNMKEKKNKMITVRLSERELNELKTLSKHHKTDVSKLLLSTLKNKNNGGIN